MTAAGRRRLRPDVTVQQGQPVDWAAFLRTWRRLHGRAATAHELCELAAQDPQLWAGTFPMTSRGDLPSVKSLGRILTGRLDRPAGGLVVRSVIDVRAKVRLYWVDPAGQPAPINRLAGDPDLSTGTT